MVKFVTMKEKFISLAELEDYTKLNNLAFFKTHTPSNLDRKRMEQISKKSRSASKIINQTDAWITQIVGAGGTGKTITMLQVAQEAFQKFGERSIFLTYNIALASDIQRLVYLSGLTGGDKGEIKIQTVMSFVYGLLFKANLISDAEFENTNFEDYDFYLNQLVDLFKDDNQGISSLIANYKYDFDFDRVFIDEAQDWSQNEVTIIQILFPNSQITVANSGQQMIRNKISPNWFKDVALERRSKCNLSLAFGKNQQYLLSFVISRATGKLNGI